MLSTYVNLQPNFDPCFGRSLGLAFGDWPLKITPRGHLGFQNICIMYVFQTWELRGSINIWPTGMVFHQPEELPEIRGFPRFGVFWSCEVGTNLIRNTYIYTYIYIRIYIYIHPMYVQVAILCIMIIHPVLCRYHQLPFPFFFQDISVQISSCFPGCCSSQLNIIDTRAKLIQLNWSKCCKISICKTLKQLGRTTWCLLLSLGGMTLYHNFV